MMNTWAEVMEEARRRQDDRRWAESHSGQMRFQYWLIRHPGPAWLQKLVFWV